MSVKSLLYIIIAILLLPYLLQFVAVFRETAIVVIVLAVLIGAAVMAIKPHWNESPSPHRKQKHPLEM